MSEPTDPPKPAESLGQAADRTVSVQTLESDDMAGVASLLAKNDLPYRDIRREPVEVFGVVVNGDVVAVGGLERYDSAGLVRSVVVEESFRGKGLGTRLCDELEARARESGVETVYLLTTTAADFFRARGYDVVDRSEAPARIRETSEFQDLCPMSATCMRKFLG